MIVHMEEICDLDMSPTRSQWSRGLRHVLSSSARKLVSWVRIPPYSWVSVFVNSVFMPSGV
jgi:hypothetical protein